MVQRQEENIHFNIGANLQRGIEAVGGMLRVSEERLFFQPHRFNIQKKELEVPMHQIARTEKAKSFGFIPNRLKIIEHDGTQHTFIIGRRDEMIAFIESNRGE
ncbi:GRAM domain-containing protein [Aureibacillus halotolerans]|uniref:GRAM domain-containing protein n=1 Tax=Aureibacillus halotolerans TaxID=1508390 RepID=A0A4R6TRI3_9BACI|nr:GRAM domain-containing protein [Aureibacillus halotolerans]TDQ34635.1 GRAM domain-containing protein [Aureibacillus halotolerans]